MSGRVTSRLAATLAAALVALAPAAVSAAPGSGGGGGSGGTVGDVLVAYVSVHRRSGGSGGGGGGDGCSWGEIVGGLAPDGFGPTWPRERDGVTYRLWIRRCGRRWTRSRYRTSTPLTCCHSSSNDCAREHSRPRNPCSSNSTP